MKTIAIASIAPLVLILSILAMDLFRAVPAHSPMPCKWEDEIAVGTGDFVQGYGWEGMTCIPADDYNPDGANWPL